MAQRSSLRQQSSYLWLIKCQRRRQSPPAFSLSLAPSESHISALMRFCCIQSTPTPLRPAASLCDCAHPPAWHLLETAACAQTDICRREPGDNWEMGARIGNRYSALGSNSQDKSPSWTRQPHALHQQSYVCFFFFCFLNHKSQIVFGHRVKLPTTSSAVVKGACCLQGAWVLL